MRMHSAFVIFCLLVLLFIPGCTRTENNAGEAQRGIIEIRETMFLTHINHIYMNSRSYLGRTIRLEGVFIQQQWGRQNLQIVFRRTPDSCCGVPGMVGFEVAWAENQGQAFPESGSWVEATGVFRVGQRGTQRYYFLELLSLNVLERRGAEFVMR